MSTSNDSCYNFSKKEADAASYTKLCVASLGIAACLLVIVLIISSKSYKHFVFRLVIYFMLADMFQAVTHILELTPVTHVNGVVVVKDGWDAACAAFGFLDQIALWMGNMGILWIMFYLLWLIHQLKKLQSGAPPETVRLYQASLKAELVGIFFLLFFPFTFNWIPFIWDMYGLSGLWCWIKVSRWGQCKDFRLGLILMFSMFYGPLTLIILFSFGGFVAITIILYRGAIHQKGLARRIYRRGTKEMVLIVVYPIIYNILCLILIINRIYSAVSDSEYDTPFFPLWIAHAIADPGRVLLPPVAFLLHPKSWKSMFSSRKQESSSETRFSIPPEDSDIDNGITIYGTTPRVNDYGAVLEPQ